MSRETPIYRNNDHLFSISVTDKENVAITGGSCSLTIKDRTTKNEIDGAVWPLALIENSGIPGLYEIIIPNELVLAEGQLLNGDIVFTKEGNTGSWVLSLKAQDRKTQSNTQSTL
jgi:hypothetical protein